MSTLSHTTHHSHIRTRAALIAVIVGAAVALIVALTIAQGGSSTPVSDPQPTRAELQQQLEAVNGARLRLPPRPEVMPESPAQQLQAVAGARFHQPVGNQNSR
jgi:hypothetical protein